MFVITFMVVSVSLRKKSTCPEIIKGCCVQVLPGVWCLSTQYLYWVAGIVWCLSIHYLRGSFSKIMDQWGQAAQITYM